MSQFLFIINKMSHQLKFCKNKQHWNRFIKNSPQGNIFAATTFLNALEVDYDLLFFGTGKKVELGAIVLKKSNKPLQSPYDLTLYQGVYFSQALSSEPPHTQTKRKLEVMEIFLKRMTARYKKVSFCLHYNFKDLRSFQWFNYHQQKKYQFKIGLRYTGLLDLAEAADFESYLSTIRKLRRRDYKKAQSLGLSIETSQDFHVFEKLYLKTFSRQKIKISPKVRRLLKSITQKAWQEKFGELSLCRDTKGRALSATLFLFDKTSAYYLVGANDPEYRKTGCGTFLMLHNIKKYQQKGLQRLDFCGINSPLRGDFKTSFNAQVVPFFIVNWNRPG